MPYGDLVLPLVFGPLLIAALAFTVRALIGWSGLRKEAGEDYDYRLAQGMIAPDRDRDHYIDTYRRVNGPRFATHAAVALWAILLLTPVVAIVLEFLLDALWQASGQSRVFEPGYLVWAFFIFFGMMGSWALIAWAAAVRYHRYAPARFEDELGRRAGRLPGTTKIAASTATEKIG